VVDSSPEFRSVEDGSDHRVKRVLEMTEKDLSRIESVLSTTLPRFYRDTMLDYPFPADSFANEFLLPNTVKLILELNLDCAGLSGTGKPFLVGSDGGEELYFIDLDSTSTQVFTCDLETGKRSLQARDWPEYLRQITASLTDIDEDERRNEERKAAKRWWQIWKQ
jgi:hypothetical protein